LKDIKFEIKNAKEEIQLVMQANLSDISEAMIKQVMANKKKLPNALVLNSTKDIKPKGAIQYKRDLASTLAVVASDALDQARKEVPGAKNVKLMENEHRLLFGEFDELPTSIKKRIRNANQLLIGTQIADLEKALFFQFTSSVSSDKSDNEIEFDMKENANDYIKGASIISGSSVVAANTVNEARNAFFFDKDTLNEIEAFQFMNGDPVSAICNDLAGTIFAKDDPDHFRYTPPLHYNCKSWIRPIIKLKKNDKVEKLKPSTKKLEDTIQFGEIGEACSCTCQDKNHFNL